MSQQGVQEDNLKLRFQKRGADGRSQLEGTLFLSHPGVWSCMHPKAGMGNFVGRGYRQTYTWERLCWS